MFSFKSFEKSLLLLLVLSFVKSIVWGGLFPIFQGPDEPAYFSYIQFLAENKRLPRPPFEKSGSGVSSELQFIFDSVQFEALKFSPFNHQIFSTASSLQNEIEPLLLSTDKDPKPRQNYVGYGYPPLYALLNLPFYFLFQGNPLLQLFSMRILSVFSQLGVVALAYFFGTLFFRSSSSGNLASFTLALSVAFFPMMSHISALVHVDTLLNFAFAGFFYMCLKLLTHETPTRSDWIFLGIWSLLTFISKTHGFAVVPILIFFFICKFRHRLLLIIRKKIVFSLLSLLGFIVASIFILSKTYFFRHFSLAFHTALNFIADNSFLSFVKTLIINGFIRPIYFSFFAKFGWLDTMLEKPYYPLIGFFVLLSLFGLILSTIKHYRSHGIKNIPPFYPFFLLSLSFVVTIYLIYSLSYYSYSSGRALLEFSQGRYYFFFLIPLFAFFLKGLLSLFPQRFSKGICFSVGFFVLFFHFITVIQYILPRYYG